MSPQCQPSFALRTVVPFRLGDAKTGLSPALDRDDREALALAMLRDILDACPGDVEVVTPDPLPGDLDADVVTDPAPLNDALETRLDDGLPALILPADLPLIRSRDVEDLLAEEGDVVIAPGLRGGTNALLLRERIPLRYGGRSFPRHVAAARDRDLDLAIHESLRFAVDVDTPEDLVEIELHGDGRAADLLEELREKGALRDEPYEP